MSMHRHALPQLTSDKLFLIDGGLETDLIFYHGVDLPLFASITLFRDEDSPKLERD